MILPALMLLATAAAPSNPGTASTAAPAVPGNAATAVPAQTPAIRLEIGPDRIVCGVTVPAKIVRKPGLILWFHGGMRSRNREKGLEAHRQLLAFVDPSRFVLASASAFAERDWLNPASLATVDALIDTLHALYPLGSDLRLVGVSDGCLGVIRYASTGRRRPGRMVLVSSLPQLAVTAEQLRSDPRLREGQWDFLQGGRDRLFPSQVVLPFLTDWESLNAKARLHFYPEGEHDFAYYATHAAPLLRSLLAVSPQAPKHKKPKKS